MAKRLASHSQRPVRNRSCASFWRSRTAGGPSRQPFGSRLRPKPKVASDVPMPSTSSAASRSSRPASARPRARTAVSPVFSSVSDDMRPNAPMDCSMALTPPLAAVATMPSNAQRNRPSSTCSKYVEIGPANRQPTPTTDAASPTRSHQNALARCIACPPGLCGRTAEMRRTAASVRPPSARLPTMPTVAASTA